jgi:hypothetical protein
VPTPPRPTSIGIAGQTRLEWMADITPESPTEFSGMRMLELIDDLCDKILALHGDQLRWALRV